MSDFKPLYRNSYYEAVSLNEENEWKESFKENQRCRDFIDLMVEENFDGFYFKGEIPEKVVAEFGLVRTMWVLANHINQYNYDKRISISNKSWAKEIPISYSKKEGQINHNREILLNTHNTLVDHLATKVHRIYLNLNLYDHRHIVQSEKMQEYNGELLILRADMLKESFRTPENQLFLAEEGFGCSPSASRGTIYGYFLIDGEKSSFKRCDFIGICDENNLPDWAKEKLKEIQEQNNEENLNMKFLN